VGWKYDKAYKESEKYKEGKYILEVELLCNVTDTKEYRVAVYDSLEGKLWIDTEENVLSKSNTPSHVLKTNTHILSKLTDTQKKRSSLRFLSAAQRPK
jgi:hypothetical protein